MSSGSATIVVDGYTFTISVTGTVTTGTTGVQAGRIADLLEPFGGNTFSSLTADANLWGPWPADYSAPSVIAGMQYITNNSGLVMQGREYHYAGRESIQAPWLKQVTAATGAKFTMCVGSNGSSSDVASLRTLAADPANNIAWTEGLNEPNWDNGGGAVPKATALAVQTALGATSIGPSIVVGFPSPESWIAPGYLTATEAAQLACAFSNGHYYPSTLPDLDNGEGRGGEFDSLIQGLRKAYGAKPPMVTEWHPSLFNADATKRSSDALDAYYAPITLLSAYRLGVRGMFWFSMFDWKDPSQSGYMKCGLFPKTGGVSPRPVASVLRALFTLTGDKGATKRTFAPGRLDYTISNLPPPVNTASPHSGGQHDLFQASDGRFFLIVRNAQAAPGGTATPVTIRFPTSSRAVKEYNITSGSMTPVQSISAPSSIISQLDASVRLFIIN